MVESVAFTVCGGLGVDMTGASIPYLASWVEQAPLQTIEATAGLIDRLARRIEDAVDAAQPVAGETGSDRGIGPSAAAPGLELHRPAGGGTRGAPQAAHDSRNPPRHDRWA